MASIRSDEAVQGSAESGSCPKPAADPEHTDARILHYFKNAPTPVGFTAIQEPVAKPGLPCQRDYSDIFGSVDNLLRRESQSGPNNKTQETSKQAEITFRFMGLDSTRATQNDVPHRHMELRLT
ncbi:hypothetical protein K449DRAFT_402292 [Hypoxylon sp. EC38]|nr:hypothetical protein K449DRAFT_402292 [Hypoxylon sp. EC38]